MIHTQTESVTVERLQLLEQDLATPRGVFPITTTDAKCDMVRHHWLDIFANLVHQMVVAQSARNALESGLPRAGVAVVTLPSWAWLPAKVNVGANKNNQLMPARIAWSAPQVLVFSETVSVDWTIDTLGHHESGTLTIHAVDNTPDYGFGTQTAEAPVPATVAAERISSARANHALTELCEGGRSARWLALEHLKRSAIQAVDRARFGIARELNPTGSEPMFDELTRDRIATSLLYGEDGDALGETSPVWRMLDRCLKPCTFTAVDPMHYVRTAINRDALDAAKRHLGDPRVGARVRAVAKTLNTADVVEVVTKYRELYPGDHLSRRRAINALTVSPDISTQTVLLQDHHADTVGNHACWGPPL